MDFRVHEVKPAIPPYSPLHMPGDDSAPLLLDNDMPRTPSTPYTKLPHVPRRFSRVALRITFAAFIICNLVLLGIWHSSYLTMLPPSEITSTESHPPETPDQRYALVKGPPTMKFRDNLQPEIRYITGWLSAGWTNDVMAYLNLIYLGVITKRVPVVAMFQNGHLTFEAGTVAFGDVFDIPRLSAALDLPILEWRDVKNSSSKELDEIGCWSAWEMFGARDPNKEPSPRASYITDILGLDISYTPMPKDVATADKETFVKIYGMAAVASGHGRQDALNQRPKMIPNANPPHSYPRPSPKNRVSMLPDDHLVCYDEMYYVSTAYKYEWNYEFWPAWSVVGTHVHFLPEIENRAWDYIARALGSDVAGSALHPPFIGIHARRANFANYCKDIPREECYAPLSAFARRVEEVLDDIWESGIVPIEAWNDPAKGDGHALWIETAKQGGWGKPNAKNGRDPWRDISGRLDEENRGDRWLPVIMTSDEADKAWWAEVSAIGWKWIDHEQEKSVEKYGTWGGLIVDGAIQSMGVGFIGTLRSTMSDLAVRRVRDWQNGQTRMVNWGRKDADAH